MGYTTLELLPEFKHRYKINAGIYSIQKKVFDDVILFLDLGCYNTLIPKDIAIRSGHFLGFKREYSIGGNIIETEAYSAYSIEKIILGSFVIERVTAFAAIVIFQLFITFVPISISRANSPV